MTTSLLRLQMQLLGKKKSRDTSSQVPGCSLVKALKTKLVQAYLKSMVKLRSSWLIAIPHKCGWGNEAASGFPLHPKAHCNILSKPPAPKRSHGMPQICDGNIMRHPWKISTCAMSTEKETESEQATEPTW